MEDWITLADYAAELVGYRSVASLKNDARAGKIEARKDGRNWEVNRDGARAQALIRQAEEQRAARDRRAKERIAAANAQDTIARLQETIEERNATIADLEDTIAEQKEVIAKLEEASREASIRYQTAEHLFELLNTGTKHTAGRTVRNTSTDRQPQDERDAQTLAQWNAYLSEHPEATKAEFAQSIGRARTTVTAQIKRALARI